MNRFLMPCLLLLLAACVSPLPAQTSPEPFDAHIQAAEAASRAGLPLAAAREYRAALMLHPDDAAACFALAGQLEKAGRPGDAIAAYQETIRLRPDNAPAHNALGMLLEDRGETAAALAQYRQALALDPKDALLHFNLAAALEAAGQPALARAEYQAALRLKPDFAEARAALKELPLDPVERSHIGPPGFLVRPPDPWTTGLRLERAGRTAEAIAEFNAVLTQRPTDAAALLHRGIALYADGQTQAARRDWQRILTLNHPPESAQARRLLAKYP